MTLQSGTRGNPEGDILVVGEAYGSNEARAGLPLVGASGKEFDLMLQEAGIDPNRCYYTNVVNKQPAGNNMTRFFIPHKKAKEHGIPAVRGLHPDIPVLEGLDLLEEVITKLCPTLIIALGNYALWALSDDSFKIANGTRETKSVGFKVPSGIMQFRGSQLRSRFENIPLLPIFHPAAVLRNWEWRFQTVHDLRARVPLAFTPGAWDEPERNYIIRPAFEDVMGCLNNLILRAEMSPTPLLIAADIETLQPHMECIGLAWSRRDAICIPVMSSDHWDGYWSMLEETEIFLTLKRLLEHPNIEVVGQNYFYDYQYLFYYWGIRSSYKHDTMLAHHVCWPGLRMGLDFLSSLYCDWHCYWKEDGKEATKEGNDDQRWVYNCRDCVTTYEIIEELWKIIARLDLTQQYAIQMVRANSAIGMMMRGVRIDEKRRGEERLKHMEAAAEYEAKLETLLPVEIYPRPPKKAPWYNSPQQLAEIFYDILGQKEVINRKSGTRTTDDDALSKIGAREPLLEPLTKTLSEFRSLSTFGQFINMKIGPDRRMRANFSPTTETFRYRSSGDVFGYGRNLQNLPKGNEEED